MAENNSHSQFLAIAVEAAKIAGDVIRKGFYQTKHVEHKGEVDLVTETDKACEDLIFNHLKKHFPQHKRVRWNGGGELWGAFLMLIDQGDQVRSLRMCGSCALDLCGVACGRIDLFYELGFGGPWDVAGGAVIVTEAGGVIFDPSGKEFDIMAQRVAASNPLLKDKFVEALRQSE